MPKDVKCKPMHVAPYSKHGGFPFPSPKNVGHV